MTWSVCTCLMRHITGTPGMTACSLVRAAVFDEIMAVPCCPITVNIFMAAMVSAAADTTYAVPLAQALATMACSCQRKCIDGPCCCWHSVNNMIMLSMAGHSLEGGMLLPSALCRAIKTRSPQHSMDRLIGTLVYDTPLRSVCR